ncbi:MAG: hypothetical protein M1839_002059 [Geoglossum umbratile]|nr:MAG: hypothetical protein M1839_002059 [Geoglossum umbratile]
MSTGNQIGPGEKTLLLETFATATSLLPAELREKFVLVGGASMLVLGGDRKTEDVDIVVTAEALHAFEEAAALNPRFRKSVVQSWTYTSTTPEIEGLCATIEFLGMGGGFAPEIRAARPALGGFRAGLAELILMKAQAQDARDEYRDYVDICFLLDKMEVSEESFQGIAMEDEDLEILKDVVGGLGGRYPALLSSLLQRA